MFFALGALFGAVGADSVGRGCQFGEGGKGGMEGGRGGEGRDGLLVGEGSDAEDDGRHCSCCNCKVTLQWSDFGQGKG